MCPFTICPQLALLLQEGRGHLLCDHRKPSRQDADWLPRAASTALIFGNHLIQGVPTENPHYRGSYTDFTSHGCRHSGSRLLKSLCWARDACWLAAGSYTVHSDSGEVNGPLWGAPFIKTMVPPEGPWADCFPKAPPSSIATLLDRISI